MSDLRYTPANKVLMTLLALLGAGATAGGGALLVDPTGALLGLAPGLLARTPFATFRVPGLLLLGTFGAGAFVALLLIARRAPAAPFVAAAVGFGQVVWTAVQLAMIGLVSPGLQLGCLGAGALIGLLAIVAFNRRPRYARGRARRR
jgi:hypothetical protein